MTGVWSKKILYLECILANIEQLFEGRGGGECSFPEWMQGKWEHVHVDGGTMLLKDTRNFKTYTAKCVGQRSPVAGMEEERFLVYARTQCGDEHYKCVWLKDRGDNALEMQIGEFSLEGSFSVLTVYKP